MALRQRFKWHGFSLIELLVVIAIISILMSLLLPSLKKARDTTRRIACLNQLKQIGVGGFSYASDYDGCLPIVTKTPIGSEHILNLGAAFAQDYLNQAVDTFSYHNDYAKMAKVDNILRCPARCFERVNANTVNNGDDEWRKVCSTYAFTGFGLCDYGAGNHLYPRVRVLKNNVCLVMDLANKTPENSAYENNMRYNNHSKGFPSSSPYGANILCGDGSGNWEPVNRLNVPKPGNGMCRPAKYGFQWSYDSQASYFRMFKPDGTVAIDPNEANGIMW